MQCNLCTHCMPTMYTFNQSSNFQVKVMSVFTSGGAVTSWLVDQEVWVQTCGKDIVLCS